MRTTRVSLLCWLAIGAGVFTWGGLRVLDAAAPLTPALPSTVPIGLLFVTLGILVSALGLRRRLRGDPGTRPIDPLAAARMVALAKASAHAGALLAGLYAGIAIFLLPSAGGLLRGRLGLAAVSALAALGLAGAGLLLERVTRVDPPDDPPPGSLPTPR